MTTIDIKNYTQHFFSCPDHLTTQKLMNYQLTETQNLVHGSTTEVNIFENTPEQELNLEPTISLPVLKTTPAISKTITPNVLGATPVNERTDSHGSETDMIRTSSSLESANEISKISKSLDFPEIPTTTPAELVFEIETVTTIPPPFMITQTEVVPNGQKFEAEPVFTENPTLTNFLGDREFETSTHQSRLVPDELETVDLSVLNSEIEEVTFPIQTLPSQNLMIRHTSCALFAKTKEKRVSDFAIFS